jgi:formylglycine-generating enzyme required for sulfatase activity
MSTRVRSTPDAYLGLDDATPEEWDAWHRAMLEERASVLAHFDHAAYDDASTAWSDTAFRQLFLFMYDASFYDARARRYLTDALVDQWVERYGRIDEVLLWHAYPRLGFDSRTQFDFYRQMPGGLAGLRTHVSDRLHARGIRVLVDYNPWDTGTYEELADIVAALDADGVMLDTMTDVPAALRIAVRSKKPSVVFAPELRPTIDDLRNARRSWAQWCDVGDDSTPSIHRNRWLVPRHRQLVIARWDVSRKRDIAYAFFNGAGLVLWDNIFGSLNPYTREDRRLIAETAAVLDRYQDLIARGTWLPLIPTGTPGLDANRFVDEKTRRSITTFRNRTNEPLTFEVPSHAPRGLAYVAFWGDTNERITIEPKGTQALVLDDPTHANEALTHFRSLSRRADIEIETDRNRHPHPTPTPTPTATATTTATTTWIPLPAADFDMRIRHERRECGCYPEGADERAMWGWHYKDEITHVIHATLEPFAIRASAITNAEYIAFVHASGYRPADGVRFLAHVPREADGSLPRSVASPLGELPVTHVSLDDARAFASFYGERLPSEAEWQWAATAQGVTGLSGNAWELTDTERTDGHTRFVMLRGGAPLPPRQSEWQVERGPRPNDSHAKYILLADCLDRSDTISFRTTKSLVT